jgi:hypothetical protein
MWQRSTTRRFLKWLFSWRTVRRALIGVAGLVTLWALFCAEENVRGKQAWENYRREAEAQGKQFDLAALIPKPIPDEQNFAATPFIKSWFVRSNRTFAAVEYWNGDSYGRVGSMISSSRDKKDAGNRHFTDLVAWEMALAAPHSRDKKVTFESDKRDLASRAKAAPAVLDGLRTNEAVFAQLRAASERPLSRYPVGYDLDNPFAILLPHLSNVRSVCRRLGLKACAELAAGRSAEALGDVKLTLFMADSPKEEPFIISYLVRIACWQAATQPVWEGLAEHAWSDAQLQELEARLQQSDFVSEARRSLESERACGVTAIELVRKRGPGYLNDLGSDASSPPGPRDRSVANDIGLFIPRGWYYLEEYNYCRLFDTLLGSGFDTSKKRISPGQLVAGRQEVDLKLDNGLAKIIHHRIMAAMLLPGLENFITKAAEAQTIANQAAVACALERYRLANGQFPETLDALSPRFISQLPHDVITGEPYKYRRTADGQFVLYSVGWNEKDDGGVPGNKLFDDNEGDWVWQYASQ